MAHNKDNIHFVKLSDTGSKFKLVFNLVTIFFYSFLVTPHLIVFALHPRKRQILSDTMTVKNLFLSLIFLKHYRNLFYYRVGNVKYFIKWLLPGEKSIQVPVSMQLGKSAQFVHCICSSLNAKSIGDYFVCYPLVTIGTDRLGSERKPIIGDNVTIYTGAVVVGGITIGDNVKIGANTVVVKDVPSDCTVIGSPAKIIKLKGVRVDELL